MPIGISPCVSFACYSLRRGLAQRDDWPQTHAASQSPDLRLQVCTTILGQFLQLKEHLEGLCIKHSPMLSSMHMTLDWILRPEGEKAKRHARPCFPLTLRSRWALYSNKKIKFLRC